MNENEIHVCLPIRGGGGVRRLRPLLDPPLTGQLCQLVFCGLNYLIAHVPGLVDASMWRFCF